MPEVSVIIGSDSDYEVIKPALEELERLKISYELRVLSAHRSPDLLREYIRGAERRGIKVFIAGAGMSAHLPGVIASYTTLPVIGVPTGGMLSGLDALFSMVQMPGGVPVAVMGVGKAGAKNAGILAGQILALSDPGLKKRLKTRRKNLQKQVLEKQDRLLEKIKKEK